jgi:hypothetical protein
MISEAAEADDQHADAEEQEEESDSAHDVHGGQGRRKVADASVRLLT